MSPEEAGMDALRRVAHIYNNDMTKLAYVSMFYYVLRRDGAYAGVSLWGQPGPGQHPRQFAVNDGSKRLEHAKYLFQGAAKDWPPMPSLPK
jgi:N4-(beta-N-acetylglucosaminyl)-L-asparaginase